MVLGTSVSDSKSHCVGPPRLGFLVASALARPGVVAWANNLKLGADLAIVVTLVVTIVLKLDLRSDVLSASGYGTALVFVNVGVPLGLLAYYCVPPLMGRSTLGDTSRTRQIFELLDVDGVGAVTREQVQQLLQATHGIQAGDAVTEDELDRSFASIAKQASDTPPTVSSSACKLDLWRTPHTPDVRKAAGPYAIEFVALCNGDHCPLRF